MKAMKLHLYEELLLLALRDDKGTIPSGAWHKQAIAGAVLAELLLEKRLGLSANGKIVKPLSSEPLGDGLIDECLRQTAQRDRERSLEHWLNKFANAPDLLARAAAALCDKGILSAEKTRLLWLFESRSYPELNPEPERLLLERLELALFGESTEVGPRTRIVLSLAHSTGILQQVFDKQRLKARKTHLEALIAGENLGPLAKKLIDSIQAAIMVGAILVPIIAS